jgi:hypothetical protein
MSKPLVFFLLTLLETRRDGAAVAPEGISRAGVKGVARATLRARAVMSCAPQRHVQVPHSPQESGLNVAFGWQGRGKCEGAAGTQDQN